MVVLWKILLHPLQEVMSACLTSHTNIVNARLRVRPLRRPSTTASKNWWVGGGYVRFTSVTLPDPHSCPSNSHRIHQEAVYVFSGGATAIHGPFDWVAINILGRIASNECVHAAAPSRLQKEPTSKIDDTPPQHPPAASPPPPGGRILKSIPK